MRLRGPGARGVNSRAQDFDGEPPALLVQTQAAPQLHLDASVVRVIKADRFVRRAPGGCIFAAEVRAKNRMTTTSAVIGRAGRTNTPSQRVRATTCTSLFSSGVKRGCHMRHQARPARPVLTAYTTPARPRQRRPPSPSVPAGDAKA